MAQLALDKALPAAWIDESVQPVVKNIYGASKLAAWGTLWAVLFQTR